MYFTEQSVCFHNSLFKIGEFLLIVYIANLVLSIVILINYKFIKPRYHQRKFVHFEVDSHERDSNLNSHRI